MYWVEFKKQTWIGCIPIIQVLLDTWSVIWRNFRLARNWFDKTAQISGSPIAQVFYCPAIKAQSIFVCVQPYSTSLIGVPIPLHPNPQVQTDALPHAFNLSERLSSPSHVSADRLLILVQTPWLWCYVLYKLEWETVIEQKHSYKMTTTWFRYQT